MTANDELVEQSAEQAGEQVLNDLFERAAAFPTSASILVAVASTDKGAKERMGEVPPEVVEFWIATMRDESEEMCYRMRARENIAWGFLGKPARQVFAAHAHLDVNSELPQNADELDKLATLYEALVRYGWRDTHATFE